ncbi:hypothetical protein BJ322DRAFT_663309 [Thelephora terrestris]|uniref:Uncharacterized protein n=1 Tax=Thelephora terrestris TaxID=56493 RepID=A0A9P6HJF3_9AGAM|nr:hypothetical protein BJ322DRAFT_663309 [Thelephora terrestris]
MAETMTTLGLDRIPSRLVSLVACRNNKPDVHTRILGRPVLQDLPDAVGDGRNCSETLPEALPLHESPCPMWIVMYPASISGASLQTGCIEFDSRRNQLVGHNVKCRPEIQLENGLEPLSPVHRWATTHLHEGANRTHIYLPEGWRVGRWSLEATSPTPGYASANTVSVRYAKHSPVGILDNTENGKKACWMSLIPFSPSRQASGKLG